MVSGFVEIFLTGFDFFLYFNQARRKGQYFIGLSSSWENFGQVFSSYKSWYNVLCDFILLHVCQSNAKQCLVAPVKMSTLQEVFYSDLQWLQLAIACFSSTVLEWETLCFFTQMWPEIMVSRVLRKVEHQVILFDRYFTKKNILHLFQACHNLIFMYCSWNKYCLCYLLGCGLRRRIPEYGEEIKFFYCVFTTWVLISVF